MHSYSKGIRLVLYHVPLSHDLFDPLGMDLFLLNDFDGIVLPNDMLVAHYWADADGIDTINNPKTQQ